MSPENPERLWAFTCDGTRGIRSIVATTDGQGADVHASMTRSATKPAEYVRADIAAAREAALLARLDHLSGALSRIGYNGQRGDDEKDIARAALRADNAAALAGKGVG